jgi:glyoxylase-like metal-dependent hydrolase (beta-lactamase superfamily II)
MQTTIHLTRRSALMTGAAAVLAGAAGVAPRVALAKAEMKGTAVPLFSRLKLGDFEVTTLLAGTRTVGAPHGIFGTNVSDADFKAAADAAFIPADKAQFYFTPTLVNTGAELILFDTGTDPAGLVAAITAAGYAPEQVDKVVITHMHPDHIGGLMGEGGATFANAAYVTGATEHNFWSGQANELFDKNVKPLNDKFTMIDDGGTVAPGITGMNAYGHTPGHMIFMLESGGQRLAVTADTANHYIWSLGHPDWEVKFDADKVGAAASRKKVFGMIAADRIPFIGYHMPFPATGFVEADGSGFRYVPASYQLIMGEPG